MTVIIQEADVGHMTAVGTVLMAGSLGGGAWVGKQMNFTEVISQSDHLPVMRSDQSVDVGAI